MKVCYYSHHCYYHYTMLKDGTSGLRVHVRNVSALRNIPIVVVVLNIIFVASAQT